MALAETEKTAAGSQENPLVKLLLELGPLVIFFLAYNRGEALAAWAGYPGAAPIMAATAVFIPAMAVALLLSWRIQGKIPVMPLVSFVLVAVFGGMTLYLQDETFIKMKPTILNMFFAVALMTGLWFGKLFLKTIFEEGWSITDEGWRVLTLRWSLFFVVMALLNEVIWRNFSEDFWVSFKVWGNLPITVLFAAFQFLVVMKYALPADRLERFVTALAKPEEARAALRTLREREGVDLTLAGVALWHGAEGRRMSASELDAVLAQASENGQVAETGDAGAEDAEQIFGIADDDGKARLHALAEGAPDTADAASMETMRANLGDAFACQGKNAEALLASAEATVVLEQARKVAKLD